MSLLCGTLLSGFPWLPELKPCHGLEPLPPASTPSFPATLRPPGRLPDPEASKPFLILDAAASWGHPGPSLFHCPVYFLCYLASLVSCLSSVSSLWIESFTRQWPSGSLPRRGVSMSAWLNGGCGPARIIVTLLVCPKCSFIKKWP